MNSSSTSRMQIHLFKAQPITLFFPQFTTDSQTPQRVFPLYVLFFSFFHSFLLLTKVFTASFFSPFTQSMYDCGCALCAIETALFEQSTSLLMLVQFQYWSCYLTLAVHAVSLSLSVRQIARCFTFFFLFFFVVRVCVPGVPIPKSYS